jgi:hypothetical protein
MAIIKPENMDFSGKNIIMIVSGLPGVGKTTLALSAPETVLVDFDEGLPRVKAEHRKDSIVGGSYKGFLDDLKSAYASYKTIVIDTGGAMIEAMKEWAADEHALEVTTSRGNVDPRKVFGVVKSEFLRVSREIRQKMNVIYLFHESKDKENDEIFYSLVCEGSARTLVWQPADLGAHLFIQNGERYLGFTPTAQYSAKAAYGIKGLIKVPELKDGDPNDFLTKLFTQVKANIAAESAALKPQQDAYEEAMRQGNMIVDAISTPELATLGLAEIRKIAHALTSQKELEAAFKAKVKELGYEYSKEARAYVAKAE